MPESRLKEQLKRLNQIGIALSSETNLERLLSLIVREARSFTNADGGSLYIRDGDSLQFMVAQCDTIDQRSAVRSDFKPFPLPLTRSSIAGYVALTSRPLNIPDVYELDDSVEFQFNHDFDERNDYRSQSMLVAPMLNHRGENIGVLQLINATDEDGRVIPFSEEVEDLVESLASQAAVAVCNAQLIASIKDIFAALVRYSASAIDARSPHTAGHSRRVAALSAALAEEINRRDDGPFAGRTFSPEELEELSYAAWLHDIGKIGVREHVLEKAGKLDETRMRLIRARFDQMALAVRLDHDERLLRLHENGRPSDEDVAVLRRETEEALSSLEEDFDFLLTVNAPGFVTDEQMERLHRLAACRYSGPDGDELPVLEDFELTNLGVRRGNLTDEEYREIQSHVVLTREIVNNIPFTPELARIPVFAGAHHEMLNGTGYPDRLAGDDIPLQARILAVADIFDALVARDRPYKKAMPVEKALGILREEGDNGRLDRDLVEMFIERELYKETPEEDDAELSGRGRAPRACAAPSPQASGEAAAAKA